MSREAASFRLGIALCRVLALGLSWLFVPLVQAQSPAEYARLAADINLSPVSPATGNLAVFNNALYFVANDGTHGSELWRYDGTTAVRVTDLSPGSASSLITSLSVLNGALYFRGSGTTNGTIDSQLWKYDGTNATRVTEINASSGGFLPSGMTAYNGALYFSANDGTNGNEFWSYDGSTLSIVGDLNPGAAS